MDRVGLSGLQEIKNNLNSASSSSEENKWRVRMEDLSYFEERLSTAEAELHISKKVSDRQEKIVDTKDIVLFTPETDTKDVTSNALEEHSARSENFTDETPIYCEDNEVSEMSDMDDPNLSGLSLLKPDPSFGCLPRVREFAKKKRSTPWTYVTPEEPPQQTAWKYLMKRNIIGLLEVSKRGHSQFSGPIAIIQAANHVFPSTVPKMRPCRTHSHT